jgi:microcystin degradation protein MlrC
MKIFAGGIATETNTFAPLPTGLADFQVQRGRDARAGRVEYPSLNLLDVWGKQAQARGVEFAFGLNAWAEPSGITVRSAYESLRDELLGELRAAMPVDVVLLMLHGAMVADGYEDCEEDLIRRVRQIVGAQAVIGAELDLHCHLTESMLALADIVITYKEYPHTDINERACELFELGIAAKLGTIRPTMALFDCRMAGLYPTSCAPLRAFVDRMQAAEGRDGILSISFAHSFPFADLPKMGAKLLVVADGDIALARRTAERFGREVYELRRQIGFDSISVPIEEALPRALRSKRTPVVVADQSDNVGAGAPGDATHALRWLLEHRAENVATAIVYDPEVVRIATKAGPGATLPVRLGGKLGASSGDPLDIEVSVLSVRSNYMHARPQQSGPPLLSPLGNVAALRCGGIDIVVSSKRCQCYCPSIFSDLGIDPRRKQVLIPKSTQHFQFAFAPLAGELIYMVGPGAVAPDPRRIRFRRLDITGLYPWNDDPLRYSPAAAE